MSLIGGLVTAGAQYGLESILVKPQRSLGGIVAQVTIEEVHTDELEITDHPIEQGAVISDHAFKRPAEIVIKCGWSNSPTVAGLIDGVVAGATATVTSVQSLINGTSGEQILDIYNKLLILQESRLPFDVFTGKRIYQNMLFRSLRVDNDKTTDNALMVTASLRQVILVKTSSVAVQAPRAKQPAAPATLAPYSAGNKALQPAPDYRAP
jgi:hypothetical protein